MPGETSAIRALTRRVKDLSLKKAEQILADPEKVDPELYKSTFLTVLKNAVPRAQEVTGEEGAPITLQITGMQIIKDPTGGHSIPDPQSKAA